MSAGMRAGRLVLLLALALAGVVALLVAAVLVVIGSPRHADVLRALDQFGNAGMFGGSRFETISSHVGRLTAAPGAPLWARALRVVLDSLDPRHCAREAEREAPVLWAIDAVQGGDHA